MSKAKQIEVLSTEIRIITSGHQDYISLTDMLKAKDGDFFISNCCETAIRLNFWAYGSRYTIPILIMANSP